MATPPLAGPVGPHLAQAALAAAGEVLLVRRPGRRSGPGPLRWLVVDPATRTMTAGEWESAGDLARAAQVLAAPGALAEAMGEPVVLVCTHSARDVCCAVRGRAVASVLTRRWPGQVWECSHLGGHRFAATVLVLPDGAQYGYLDDGNADQVIGAHVAGRVDASYLRGMTGAPPPAQVALVAALERYGPAGVHDATVTGLEQLEATLWRVALRGSGVLPERLTCLVEAGTPSSQRLSCRDEALKPVPAWRIVSLEAVQPNQAAE